MNVHQYIKPEVQFLQLRPGSCTRTNGRKIKVIDKKGPKMSI